MIFSNPWWFNSLVVALTLAVLYEWKGEHIACHIYCAAALVILSMYRKTPIGDTP